jgi:hypothetical protein
MARGTWRLLIAATACILGTTQTVGAQSRCRVMDPTGTPLNVRTSPYGQIVGVVPNDLLVTVLDRATDRGGRPWVYVSQYSNDVPLGWVFREFISCF